MDYLSLIELAPLWVLTLFLSLMVWSTVWKAIALWKSARNNHKVWFVIFVIFNTIGILEIFYIFLFSKSSSRKTRKKKK